MSEEFQNTIQRFIECCRNQGVDVVKSSSTEVYFITKGYLEYFDEDMAGKIISNKESIVYRPGGHNFSDRISYSDIELLMESILLNKTLKIKLCAAFKYDLKQGISSMSYDFCQGYSDYMPNPLTQLFRDLGSCWIPIHAFLSKNDFDKAISCCSILGASINLTDAVITQIFMEVLYGVRINLNNKCIELPNRNTVTPKDAIAWLKQIRELRKFPTCASEKWKAEKAAYGG